MQHELVVKSSDGDSTYVVQFVLDAEKLSIFCNCSAGAFGKFCKHKILLLAGDSSLLDAGGRNDGFSEVQEWIAQSGTWPVLLKQFIECEKAFGIAQAEYANVKKKIESGMKNGI